MRKLLVFQHVPLEPLGTLNTQFKDAGFRIRYVNFDRQPSARLDVRRYHGLIVLGGPMSADQTDRHPHLTYEQEAIADAIELQIPMLGICLGAQLLAAATGGKTLRGQAVEFGWSNVTPTPAGDKDPLFAHFDGTERIYQWHSDTFTLPRSAVHLAASPDCENQAFRVGHYAYGFQFHLEADRALIQRWLKAAARQRGVRSDRIPIDSAATLRETDRYLPRSTRLARAVFGEFIARFYRLRRRRAQPSR